VKLAEFNVTPYGYGGNYGTNALKVTVGSVTVWYSYDQPVAFETCATGLVVCENAWSKTTGKHLNIIDGGNKSSRLPVAEFEKRLQTVISTVTKVMQLLDQPEKLGILKLLDDKPQIEVHVPTS
jgi:hypothetical protein